MAQRNRKNETNRPDPFVGMGAPRADEAERYVLGCLLQYDSGSFLAAQDARITPADFYSDAHKAIAQALFDLSKEGLPTDLIAVQEKLRSTETLGVAGGLEYLQELASGVASTAAVQHHCRLVKQKSLLRMLIQASNATIFDAQEADADGGRVLGKAQQALSELAQDQVRHTLRPVGDMLDETMELIEKLVNREDVVSGTHTGFHKLDMMTTGLHGGELIILAARPGMGKTAFALALALNAVMHPQHPASVALFSLEMSADQLMLRLLSHRAQVPMQSLRSGRIAPEDLKKLPFAVNALKNASLFIDDQPDLTMLDMRTKCRMLADSLARQGRKLDLIVLDYLQLVDAGGARVESRQVFVAQVSRGLKQLAKELDVPILALSQLSRDIEKREGNSPENANAVPKLSDLRESGAIEQDADMVWFVWRRKERKDDEAVDFEAEQEAKLIVAKHRNGAPGEVPLAWIPKYAGFYEPSFRTVPGGEAPF